MKSDQGIGSLSLPVIGILISALLIGCGFLFRTYAIGMSSAGWETARQLGLPFVYAELAVIFFAVYKGFNIREVWLSLPVFVRYASVAFVSTYWISSVFTSEVVVPAIMQNVITAVHLTFAAAVYHCVAPITSLAMRQMAKWLCVGLAIFSVMTAAAFLFHPPLSSMPDNKIVWQFAIPGFISVRLFGAFCGAIFSFFLALLFLDDEKGEVTFWHCIWVTLAGSMTIWSGTRAAVLGSLVAFFVAIVFYKVRPKRQTVAKVTACILTAAFAAYLLIPYNDPNFMLFAPGDTASADTLTGGRLAFWAGVWEAYKTVPFFGAGPFASSWILPDELFRHVQPHNLILQFLLTWGIVAALPAFVLLCMAIVQAHQIAHSNRVILPFLLMLDCLLVISLFDGTMHFAQHMMLIMLCFGVIFSAKKRKNCPIAIG